MKIIDTHAHLYLKDFEEDLDDVVSKAKAIGVEKVLLPNIDEASISDLKQTVAKFPSFFIPMIPRRQRLARIPRRCTSAMRRSTT